jgi:hypothetical protein
MREAEILSPSVSRLPRLWRYSASHNPIRLQSFYGDNFTYIANVDLYMHASIISHGLAFRCAQEERFYIYL